MYIKDTFASSGLEKNVSEDTCKNEINDEKIKLVTFMLLETYLPTS